MPEPQATASLPGCESFFEDGGPMSGRRQYGETMQAKRARWEAAGDCRDCGAPGPHRLPDGQLSKRCAACRDKHSSRAPGSGRMRRAAGAVADSPAAGRLAGRWPPLGCTAHGDAHGGERRGAQGNREVGPDCGALDAALVADRADCPLGVGRMNGPRAAAGGYGYRGSPLTRPCRVLRFPDGDRVPCRRCPDGACPAGRWRCAGPGPGVAP